jgi:hypothetical protein
MTLQRTSVMLRSALAFAVILGSLSSGVTAQPASVDACLTAKYAAHRKVARDFQMQRAAILADAVPEARATIEADRDLELANNDRLEIAFKHLLAMDRKKLDLKGEPNAWVILSPELSAAVAAKVPEFATAQKRAEDAVARRTASGAFPKVRETVGKLTRIRG